MERPRASAAFSYSSVLEQVKEQLHPLLRAIVIHQIFKAEYTSHKKEHLH
jgi:hypothetical protein